LCVIASASILEEGLRFHQRLDNPMNLPQFVGCAATEQSVDMLAQGALIDSFPLKLKEYGRGNLEGFGKRNYGIKRWPFLSPFNLTEIFRVQAGFFSRFLLCDLTGLPDRTEPHPKEF
jgi:hypothetical protein